MNQDSLLFKISSVDHLTKAWDRLNKSNEGSHGLSDESIMIFNKDKEAKIRSISIKLREGEYKFRPYRPVLIPKKDGTERPLQIPEVQDRLVFKAIAMELESVFSDLLSKSNDISFAYQKDIGIRQAVEKIQHHYKQGNIYVFESDLVDFFTSVNKQTLLQNHIFPHLPDDSINNLLIDGLNQSVGSLEKHIKDAERRKYFDKSGDGIPQGNPLSPLFSNIYLSPFDSHLKRKGYNLVRYADDFVVLCKSEEDCKAAYEECLLILSSDLLKLQIHPLNKKNPKGKVKTKIFNIKEEPLCFLSITFDGKHLFPTRDNVDNLKNGFRDLCIESTITVEDLLRRMRNKLDGWVSAFYYTDVGRYEREIDYHINRQLYLGLRRLEWRFNLRYIGKVPTKYKEKRGSNECLSEKQRKNSGVPLCKELVKDKRASEKDKQSSKA